ncbi:hypothetical protein NEOLEDRAFT_1202644 [Neolentinus lepideus HHB14362 ss-1]|uniref:Nucleoporin protein Ndc1-Nup n=1 Tax=Neolentinus lepideus HHB14362 ss-1 TaxID=1314782 RepID=A0A165SR73_9AGAM|nr:hypothetical protein NEOLEDRAFT_1202644 [Neolentinus lepideus HHB14362 ss-1]
MNASTSRTPIRAKPSTLVSHAATTIPPASQTFEPAVKRVLRHRLRSIFLYSAAYCWTPAFVWNTWSTGGFSLWNLLSLSTIALSLAFWVLGALPVTLLRKFYLTATPSASSSPSKTVKAALSKRSTYAALICYSVSAVLLSGLHILLAYTNQTSESGKGEPRLSPFVKSRKHPYYLNGRFIFLMLTQLVCAYAFLLRHIMRDRFVVRWPPLSVDDEELPPRFDPTKIALTTIAVTTLSLATSTVLFGVTRILLLPILFHIPVLRLALRPFATHFLRGPWTLSLPLRHLELLFRCFALGLSTVATWEVSESIFEAQISEPITVTSVSADPVETLISGTTSSSTYFQYFAYMELRNLIWEDSPAASARRSALFADQKHSPSLWVTLCRTALLQLGKDYQHFVRRGAPLPGATTPAPAPVPPKKPDPTPSTPLIRKPIFKSSPASPVHAVIESLSSDGAITQAIASTAEVGAAHVPELFRSVAAVAPASVKEGTDVVVAEVKEVTGWIERYNPKEMAKKVQLGGVVEKYCPPRVVAMGEILKEWWHKDRLGKAAEECLPNRELDVLIIQVLAHLTCVSLDEDRYGVLQRDIPRILEAFISFYSAVGEYETELSVKFKAPSEEEREKLTPQEREIQDQIGYDVSLAKDAMRPIIDAFKEGLARIVRTFNDKLQAFRFPPRTARQLQSFVDYTARPL